MRNVLVLGGSRYFGKTLVELLRDGGDRVTVLNRGSAAPPRGVAHVVADRDDPDALAAGLGGAAYDVVLDQVCYTPVQAAAAARVFAGRTGRYVMTSTMEVYDPATSAVLPPHQAGRLVSESAVDPAAWPVDLDFWADRDGAMAALGDATGYAEGKRQAEAVFAAASDLPFAAIRSAHVVGGGARDFTGRLAYYVERVAAGRPIAVHAEAAATSFVGDRDIAAFLAWAAHADFTGAVNACSPESWSAVGLAGYIGERVGRAPRFAIVGEDADEPASPFSFDRHYAMDAGRAAVLGFAFPPLADRLAAAVDAVRRPAPVEG